VDCAVENVKLPSHSPSSSASPAHIAATSPGSRHSREGSGRPRSRVFRRFRQRATMGGCREGSKYRRLALKPGTNRRKFLAATGASGFFAMAASHVLGGNEVPWRFGKACTCRRPSPPRPTAGRESARESYESAANARTVAGPPPAGLAARVTSWRR